MEIVFLGTGTSGGVPVIGCHCDVCRSHHIKDKRFRSSVYLKKGSTALIIDTGPDFRSQILGNQIEKLDAALITHTKTISQGWTMLNRLLLSIKNPSRFMAMHSPFESSGQSLHTLLVRSGIREYRILSCIP